MEYLERDAQIRLISRLIKGTAAGKYDWEGLPKNEYTFAWKAHPFGFAIESRDKDDFAPYRLDLFDLKVDPIRKFQTIETDPEEPGISDGLEELYALVKRKVLRLENIADELFDALDNVEGNDSKPRS